MQGPKSSKKQLSHSEPLPVIAVLFLESHGLFLNVSLNKNVSDISLETIDYDIKSLSPNSVEGYPRDTSLFLLFR